MAAVSPLGRGWLKRKPCRRGQAVENSNGHVDGGAVAPDLLAEQLFTGKSTYSQLKKEISRAYWVRPEGAPARPQRRPVVRRVHSESAKP